MYFIVVLDDLDLRQAESRVVGYYPDFESAHQAVINNRCDVWETVYTYALIEKISPGLYPDVEEKWFYKFNVWEGKYEPAGDIPQELMKYNLALG
ncbi:hypothetical protein MTAT_19970 [Moorella thermoacetica]|uniref:Uncharacterized protein n=1 Tax=Neomoorella thermoacetica TaxID=1525 RepID=A0AAC9HIM4_NEOTH|nr:hypothetical protein [Moorella thermoacetica]AOQ24652.1 hypothetical protein Maut_02224 [Moorella thermoacetica]TYL12755.1 hypothetical protein MTAT_19970 [Moorella thermoacetica]